MLLVLSPITTFPPVALIYTSSSAFVKPLCAIPALDTSVIYTFLLLSTRPDDAIKIPLLPLFVNSTFPFEPMLPLRIMPFVLKLFTDVTPVPWLITEPETSVPLIDVNVIAPLFFDIFFAAFIELTFTSCSNTPSSKVLTTPVPFATIFPGTSIFEETISISLAARTLPSTFTTPEPAFSGAFNADKFELGLFL